MSKAWTRFYDCDACLDCGRADRRHWSRGLCAACWQRRYQAGVELPQPVRKKRWSYKADACVACGGTERPHRARGLCRTCYGKQYAPAPVVRAKRLKTARRLSRVARDRSYGLPGDIPQGYEDVVLEVFGARCASCGAQDVSIVLDHHRPLRQGYGLLHNAVPLCVSCNHRKKDKSPEDFYVDRWKLVLISVLLLETRDLFERRLNGGSPA